MGSLQQYLNGPQKQYSSRWPGPPQYNFYQPILISPQQYLFKWAPNNNIEPGGPGPLNVIFTTPFKWALNNNIYMAPI